MARTTFTQTFIFAGQTPLPDRHDTAATQAIHMSSAVTTMHRVAEIRNAPIEPGMLIPPILVVSPPMIRTPKGSIAPKFRGAEDRCTDLPKAYEQVAVQLGCYYFNAETVTTSSTVDGVHLDPDQHLLLGTAIADSVRNILEREGSAHAHS